MAGHGGAREGTGPKPRWSVDSGSEVPTIQRRIPACLSIDDIQVALDHQQTRTASTEPISWPTQSRRTE